MERIAELSNSQQEKESNQVFVNLDQATNNDLVSIKKQAKVILRNVENMQGGNPCKDSFLYQIEKANEWITLMITNIKERELQNKVNQACVNDKSHVEVLQH